jgi:hypothetical protein
MKLRLSKVRLKAIVLRTPRATSLGKFTGSIEFHGETNTETAIHVKIAYELSNLDVAEVSTIQGY